MTRRQDKAWLHKQAVAPSCGARRRGPGRIGARIPGAGTGGGQDQDPAGPVALAPARHLLRQHDRGGRVVHVARPALAAAVGVCAAEGAQPRRASAATPSSRSAKRCACRSTTCAPSTRRACPRPPRLQPDPHEVLRFPGQPKGRSSQERRPHGLLLHPRVRAVRAGRRDGWPPRRRGGGADGAADHRRAVPARGAPGAQGRQGLPPVVRDVGASAALS